MSVKTENVCLSVSLCPDINPHIRAPWVISNLINIRLLISYRYDV